MITQRNGLIDYRDLKLVDKINTRHCVYFDEHISDARNMFIHNTSNYFLKDLVISQLMDIAKCHLEVNDI